MLQILAAQELHREERLSLVLAEIVDGDDVPVRELAGGARFAEEALAQLGVVLDGGRDDLQGDFALEQRVVGLIDNAHPTLTDFLDDPIAPDRGSSAGPLEPVG